MWRGERPGPSPPDPWPARVEAFEVACCLHAGDVEACVVGLFELMKAVHTKKDEADTPAGWSKG